MKTPNRGFTLIELMIALGILALLMSLAAPSFTAMLKNNRLYTEANNFIAAMNIARSEAIKRGETITITAKDSSNNANEWGPGWTITTPGGDTLRDSPAMHSTISLNSIGGLGSYAYAPTGLIDNSDTLNLCDDRTGETGRQISIGNTGRVSVTDVACP